MAMVDLPNKTAEAAAAVVVVDFLHTITEEAVVVEEVAVVVVDLLEEGATIVQGHMTGALVAMAPPNSITEVVGHRPKVGTGVVEDQEEGLKVIIEVVGIIEEAEEVQEGLLCSKEVVGMKATSHGEEVMEVGIYEMVVGAVVVVAEDRVLLRVGMAVEGKEKETGVGRLEDPGKVVAVVIDIWAVVAVVGLVLEKESGIEMTLEGKIINREEERGVDHGREIEEELRSRIENT